MKKLFIIALLLVSITAKSQEYIEFLGLPLNTPKEIIELKLLEKGYELAPEISAKDNDVYWGGTFHGQDYIISIYHIANKITKILLLKDFTKYEDALKEMASLKSGTIERHNNYKWINLPVEKEKDCIIRFFIEGKEREYVQYRLDNDTNNGKYSIFIVYQVYDDINDDL